MSYIILRGRWLDIILSVHAPTEDKTDDMMGRSMLGGSSVVTAFPFLGVRMEETASRYGG
jgi:hypothetical protein